MPTDSSTPDSLPPEGTPSSAAIVPAEATPAPRWGRRSLLWLVPSATAGVLVIGWLVAQFVSNLEVAQRQSTPGEVALPETRELPPSQPANLIEAPDRSSQVVLPKGWEPAPDLNPQAQIQAANPEQQMYLVVRSQPKADLDSLTKEAFSEQARQNLVDQLTQVEQQGPSDRITQVAGFPAVQYEIRGALNDIGVVYLHTTVETPDAFTQILTWTSPADFARNEAAMQELIQGVELQTPSSAEGVVQSDQ